MSEVSDYRAQAVAVRKAAREKLLLLRRERSARRALAPNPPTAESATTATADPTQVLVGGVADVVVAPHANTATVMATTDPTGNVGDTDPDPDEIPVAAPVEGVADRASRTDPDPQVDDIEARAIAEMDNFGGSAPQPPARIVVVGAATTTSADPASDGADLTFPVISSPDVDALAPEGNETGACAAEAMEVAPLGGPQATMTEIPGRDMDTATNTGPAQIDADDDSEPGRLDDVSPALTEDPQTGPALVAGCATKAETDDHPVDDGEAGSDPLSALPGAGPGLIWMLNQCGIHSLEELAAADRTALSIDLGLVGQILDIDTWIIFAQEHLNEADDTALRQRPTGS